MKTLVMSALAKALNKKPSEVENLIETPPEQSLGDYSFPCFHLAKELKKNPLEIAKELSEKINKNDFEKVEAKGPYVNFFLDLSAFSSKILSKISLDKNNYGKCKGKKLKCMVEFSQPNTHKAFHIGHVRGTSLGESISRILEFSGDNVVRANYSGDTGMHIAKWIWCYNKFHSKEKLLSEESWFAGIYVDAVKRLAENPDLQAEVDEINLKMDSRSDKSINTVWSKTRELSIKSWEKIYSQLQTQFDVHFFESEVESRGKELAKELVKKKLAVISEGATIMDLKPFNLGVWVLLRKDGTVLYSAKDLALAEKKFNEFKIHSSIYVVGKEQELHMYQLFKTLELMKFKQAKNCKYIPITEVRLPTGKMSSRTGENILYSDFIKELSAHVEEEIAKRDPLSKEDLKERALAIAVSSLKYSMLKQDVNKGIVFDKSEAMSFEGNTGAYLLYTYARARSILNKSPPLYKKFNAPKQLTLQEKQLLLKLASFPEIVARAYSSLAPNEIANYAYSLAKLFNEFYHSSQVIGSEQEQFRLQLVDASSQVLKNALNLLGIFPLERM